MNEAFICDAVRTPFGRYGGALSSMRADDLGAIPLRALMERNPGVDWGAVEDVTYGCANQAGEDDRDVGGISLFLAGLPQEVAGYHGQSVVRLESRCDCHRSACHQERRNVAHARRRCRKHVARTVRTGKGGHGVFSGGEDRGHDYWLAIHQPADESTLGVDSMPETAENVAQDFMVSRTDQDAFALRSQQRTADAIAARRLAEEIVPVTVPSKKGEAIVFRQDEHPRATTLEALAKLKGVVRPMVR